MIRLMHNIGIEIVEMLAYHKFIRPIIYNAQYCILNGTSGVCVLYSFLDPERNAALAL